MFYLVVRRVDKNFINDLEETRNVFHLAMHHAFCVRIIGPHCLSYRFHTTDVRIRSFQDVFQLCKLEVA